MDTEWCFLDTSWQFMDTQWHFVVTQWHFEERQWHLMNNYWQCVDTQWHFVDTQWYLMERQWHFMNTQWQCMDTQWQLAIAYGLMKSQTSLGFSHNYCTVASPSRIYIKMISTEESNSKVFPRKIWIYWLWIVRCEKFLNVNKSVASSKDHEHKEGQNDRKEMFLFFIF